VWINDLIQIKKQVSLLTYIYAQCSIIPGPIIQSYISANQSPAFGRNIAGNKENYKKEHVACLERKHCKSTDLGIKHPASNVIHHPGGLHPVSIACEGASLNASLLQMVDLVLLPPRCVRFGKVIVRTKRCQEQHFPVTGSCV